MLDATMLYRHPGPHKLHGDSFAYIIVPSKDIQKYLKDGWYRTTIAAKAHSANSEQKELYTIPPSELTEAQISNIRIAEGTQREIASRFNVTTFTVSRIKNGKIK